MIHKAQHILNGIAQKQTDLMGEGAALTELPGQTGDAGVRVFHRIPHGGQQRLGLGIGQILPKPVGTVHIDLHPLFQILQRQNPQPLGFQQQIQPADLRLDRGAGGVGGHEQIPGLQPR